MLDRQSRAPSEVRKALTLPRNVQHGYSGDSAPILLPGSGRQAGQVDVSKPNDVQSSSGNKLAKLKHWLHID
jgi:hypothetical protein